jgi:competence protein ComEC
VSTIGFARAVRYGSPIRADARLIPAAMCAWVVAIVGATAGWAAAAGLTVSALVVALVAAFSLRSGAGSRGAAVLAASGCVVAVGMVVTAQAAQWAHHPLRAAAAAAQEATVRVVTTGDPAPILGAGSAGYGDRRAGATQVAVPVELRGVEVDGRSWRAGGRLLILSPTVGWDRLLPGVELTASGWLAPATRADYTVAVLRVRGPPGQVGTPPWWQSAAGMFRDGLRAAVSVLPEQSAQLMPGLVLGDTGGMSWTLREEFRTTGLSHLVAVSGANLVIVCGAVFALLALCRAGPRGRAIGSMIAVVGFVVLVRPSPSVLRAAVMGSVGLLAVVLGRERSVLPALAASVIALLLVDPALATDPGFALSVLATAALVLIAPGWTARLRGLGLPPVLAEAIAVPAAAHLVTAPVVAGLSGQVSLVAVLANLLVAPVVAPVTVLGVLAAMLAPVSLWLARLCVSLAGPGVAWLVLVAHHGAAIPNGALPWPAGWPGALALALALVVGYAVVRRRRPRALILAVLVGALLVLIPTRVVTPGWPARGWVLVACDVGQGDAIVLATGYPGQAVLIDTGTATGTVEGCLSRLGVRSLALVVLTHMHADHVGGLDSALHGRAASAVAVGWERSVGWAFTQVTRVAADHHTPVQTMRAGEVLRWPRLTLSVLGPVDAIGLTDSQDGTDVNNTSLVMRAATPAGSVLLCGDAEVAAQSELLESRVDVRADVLKLCHHGSRYSSPQFLEAVRPRVVLVSVGADNGYGHPNPGVLGLLRQEGALIRRTDESGDLAVVPSGGGLAVVARGYPLPAPRRRHPQPRPG